CRSTRQERTAPPSDLLDPNTPWPAQLLQDTALPELPPAPAPSPYRRHRPECSQSPYLSEHWHGCRPPGTSSTLHQSLLRSDHTDRAAPPTAAWPDPAGQSLEAVLRRCKPPAGCSCTAVPSPHRETPPALKERSAALSPAAPRSAWPDTPGPDVRLAGPP